MFIKNPFRICKTTCTCPTRWDKITEDDKACRVLAEDYDVIIRNRPSDDIQWLYTSEAETARESRAREYQSAKNRCSGKEISRGIIMIMIVWLFSRCQRMVNTEWVRRISAGSVVLVGFSVFQDQNETKVDIICCSFHFYRDFSNNEWNRANGTDSVLWDRHDCSTIQGKFLP